MNPGTSSLSGFCPRACFPRMAPATWANDVPLETAGDRYEPLGSDGMWTKRGPGTPARGAATLRLADLAWQGRPPPAAPTSEPRPAITLLGEPWRVWARVIALERRAVRGHRHGGTP